MFIRLIPFLVLMFATPVLAGPHGGEGPFDHDGRRSPGEGHKGFNPEKLFEAIKATPEQKTKIADLFKAGRAEGKPLMEARREAQKKLMETLEADPSDLAAIKAAHAKVAAAGEALILHRAKTMSAVDQILTPEQRVQAKAKRAEFKERMQKRFEEKRREHGGSFDDWIEKHASK